MSKGSQRITIRIPDELREDLDNAVDKRNDPKTQTKHWTLTEYIVQAIVEKLNHDNRSCKRDYRKRQCLPSENMRREYWEE